MQVYQKSWWHAVLFLRYGAWHMSLFLILGYFLPFYPSKFPKNQKNSWRYQHFTHVYQRWWLDDVWFLGYGIQQTDAWTDGQKKWHIEVAAPPKKISISNRVQLSLGSKKKKTIVNQILLSKLWYIGQIYTISKFIKEEIEKTTAQLSIWKCGKGILDIDTQLNSL